MAIQLSEEHVDVEPICFANRHLFLMARGQWEVEIILKYTIDSTHIWLVGMA